MAFGLDSRALMAPGGATQGFGNLASALIMAPRLRGQQEDAMAAQERERADRLAAQAAERNYRDRGLAQSLQIHMDNQRSQDEERAWRRGRQAVMDQEEIDRRDEDAARKQIESMNLNDYSLAPLDPRPALQLSVARSLRLSARRPSGKRRWKTPRSVLRVR
jgi:hypothetical protein